MFFFVFLIVLLFFFFFFSFIFFVLFCLFVSLFVLFFFIHYHHLNFMFIISPVMAAISSAQIKPDMTKPEIVKMRPFIKDCIPQAGNSFWPNVKADVLTLRDKKKLVYSESDLFRNAPTLATCGLALLERAFEEQGWVVNINYDFMTISKPEPVVDPEIKARAVEIAKILYGRY